MNLYKIFFSVLFGAFFCLLVLVPFVLYTCGILPAVFAGLCALLVLCLLAFCSWQYDYVRKTELALEEIRSLTNKLYDKYNGQQAEILKLHQSLQRVIKTIKTISDDWQKKQNMTSNSTGTRPIARNMPQSGSVKFQSAASTIQRTSSAKGYMLPGIAHNGSIKNLPTSKAVQTAGSKQTYSVKAEIKKSSFGNLPTLSIYRDGAGAFRLTGRQLMPAGMQEGQPLNKSQLDAINAYDMRDLFEVNSSKLLNHKITKIVPAQIAENCDFEINSRFEAALLKKGSIEVENPVT